MNTIQLNKSDYRLIGVYFLTIGILKGTDVNAAYYSLARVFVEIPIFILEYIFLLFLFLKYLIPKYLIDKKNYFLFIGISIFSLFCIGWLERILWRWTLGVYSFQFPTIIGAIEYVILTMNNFLLPLGFILTKKYYENQLHLSSVLKKQKESELRLLRAQIDPHFLFNNLNTVTALIDSSTAKAKRYIANLSAIYRHLITTKDEDFVPLVDEMTFAKNYCALMSTRYGNGYEFVLPQNMPNTTKYIPVGVLQMLIENAIKHNRISEHLTVTIEIVMQEETVTVKNNTTEKRTQQETHGTGLQNLKERYHLLLNKNIDIQENQHEFSVTVPIVSLTE